MATGESKARFSIPAIIAICAALASFFVGALGGFALAVAAIVFGVIGVVMSMSSEVRGGAMSILSVVVAAIAVLASVMKALAWVL